MFTQLIASKKVLPGMERGPIEWRAINVNHRGSRQGANKCKGLKRLNAQPHRKGGENFMKKYKWFTLISIFSVMLVGCANFLMKDLSEDMMLANQGLQEISKENYIRAEIYLKRALKLNPNNPYALLNMGVLYQNMDSLKRRVKCIRGLSSLIQRRWRGTATKIRALEKRLSI